MTREELEVIKRKLTHRGMVNWYEVVVRLIEALEEAWAKRNDYASRLVPPA